MVEIVNESEFRTQLARQPVAVQRKLAARFIEQVQDLSDDQRVKSALDAAGADHSGAEELSRAYQSVHSLYVETHPRSDLSELDFKRQAAHFVTEACLVALSPVYEGEQPVNLAQKTAMYCRMARTCASMKHDQEQADFSGVAEQINAHNQAQYRAAAELLGG